MLQTDGDFVRPSSFIGTFPGIRIEYEKSVQDSSLNDPMIMMEPSKPKNQNSIT